MNTLLVAINAKYIHSNLAVYSLKASAGTYEPHVAIAEYTINHQTDTVFRMIFQKKPELLFFSCYIWNVAMIKELAADLHKVLPKTKIWIGGPEVSYDAETFLCENPAFTGVLCGEGEQTFARLLAYYYDGIGTLQEIPGLVYRAAPSPEEAEEREGDAAVCKGRYHGDVDAACRKEDAASGKNETLVQTGAARLLPSLDVLPFVYRDLKQFENRILYYESSRGCPFSCSYCLSSIDKRVRFRSMELVRQELDFFLKNKVRQVKFVDRTFNCSHAHAAGIWRYLLKHDNGVTNFHFEISADLLNEEELQILSQMRPGLVQLEIGVQTVNPEALLAIHRTALFDKIKKRVQEIAAFHNIHQHLDLIAGLPYEDLESFKHSFDTVYRLHPQELQLGFLKVLKGSEMHEKAGEYGILCRSRAPYEVLETKWISCNELLYLKELEEMLEIYFNSHQFDQTIVALEKRFERPFALYEALAQYHRENGLYEKAWSRMQRFEILRGFIRYSGFAETYWDELLTLDLYLRENAKSRPEWSADLTQYRDQIMEFYRREEQEHQLLPEYEQMNWKQMMRMTHLERLAYDAAEIAFGGEKIGCGTEESDRRKEVWLLFDYKERDPLTYDARVIRLDESYGLQEV